MTPSYFDKMEDFTLNIQETVSFVIQDNIFITHVPGKIVFGEVNENGVINTRKQFTIFYSDYNSFYKTLVSIINFFSDGNASKEIIKQTDSTIYYWCGLCVVQNNEEIKCIKLGIEMFNSERYEMILNQNEFLNFVHLTKLNMIMSLNLCEETLSVLNKLIKEPLEKILKFENDECFAEQYVIKAKQMKVSKMFKVLEQLKYYSNFVIMMHKFQLFDENLIEQKNKVKKDVFGITVNGQIA